MEANQTASATSVPIESGEPLATAPDPRDDEIAALRAENASLRGETTAETAPASESVEARLARLEEENAALKRGELPPSEEPVTQHGTDLVQEQRDGSRAVIGTHSPDE